MADRKVNKADRDQMRAIKARAKEIVATGVAPAAAMRQAVDEEIKSVEEQVASVVEQARATPADRDVNRRFKP